MKKIVSAGIPCIFRFPVFHLGDSDYEHTGRSGGKRFCGARLERSVDEFLGGDGVLKKCKMCFFRRLAILETYVGRSIVDPLDIHLRFFRLIRTIVILSEGNDVSSVEIIDTSNVNFIPLWLETRIFGVNGWY